jgi:hypothetical protein
MTPTLIIVGADKGGVGKTTIARVLLDYLKDRGVKPSVFDSEPDPGVLRRFYNYAKLVDIATMQGQMTVFDEVPKSGTTVLDLCAGSLSKILGTMRDAGFLNDVKEGKMRLQVIHVLGSTEASLREIGSTAGLLLDGGEHILVKNHATDGQFFEWDKETHDNYFRAIDAKALLNIPHLDGMVCDAIEKRGQPFAGFIGDENNSRMQRGAVIHWRKQAWSEFDRAKLI